jgi:hypothetical protein
MVDWQGTKEGGRHPSVIVGAEMTNKAIFQNSGLLDDLRGRLAECSLVSQYGPEEAGTLVHAFTDLEESMRTFLSDQLPRLIDPTLKSEALEDVLMDVREEFRHILYHLHDPQFFRIAEPTHDWLIVAETGRK